MNVLQRQRYREIILKVTKKSLAVCKEMRDGWIPVHHTIKQSQKKRERERKQKRNKGNSLFNFTEELPGNSHTIERRNKKRAKD